MQIETPPVDAVLLTVAEACALARISRRTLYNWRDRNRFDYVRVSSGGMRIIRASLFAPVGPDRRGALVSEHRPCA